MCLWGCICVVCVCVYLNLLCVCMPVHTPYLGKFEYGIVVSNDLNMNFWVIKVLRAFTHTRMHAHTHTHTCMHTHSDYKQVDIMGLTNSFSYENMQSCVFSSILSFVVLISLFYCFLSIAVVVRQVDWCLMKTAVSFMACWKNFNLRSKVFHVAKDICVEYCALIGMCFLGCHSAQAHV